MGKTYIRVLKTKQECTEEYCALMEQYAEIRRTKEELKFQEKKDKPRGRGKHDNRRGSGRRNR